MVAMRDLTLQKNLLEIPQRRRFRNPRGEAVRHEGPLGGAGRTCQPPGRGQMEDLRPADRRRWTARTSARRPQGHPAAALAPLMKTARKQDIVLAYVLVTRGRLPDNLDKLLRAMREMIGDMSENEVRAAVRWALRQTKHPQGLSPARTRRATAANSGTGASSVATEENYRQSPSPAICRSPRLLRFPLVRIARRASLDRIGRSVMRGRKIWVPSSVIASAAALAALLEGMGPAAAETL